MRKQAKIPAPKKRKFLFSKLGRLLPYSGILLAVLIVIFRTGIRNYTASVVGSVLMTVVKSETKGAYTVEYDQVQFDIFSDQLMLTNFSIQLDTLIGTEDQHLEKNPIAIELLAPRLVIEVESLFSFVFSDKFNISSIVSFKPNVTVIQRTAEADTTAFANKAGSFYETIEKSLKSLRIADIQVDSASILVRDQQQSDFEGFRINNISARLGNVSLDSLSKSNIFGSLYSDQLELDLRDQYFILNDDLHEVSFDRLTTSSSESTVVITNLEVKPRYYSQKDKLANLYDFKIPKISVSGIDFAKIYRDNKLSISEIEIAKPEITLTSQTTQTDASNTLPGLLTEVFDEIEIGKLMFNDGVLAINRPDLNQKINIANVSVDIVDYKIDTSTYNLKNHFLEFGNVEVDINNYQFQAQDSIHTFNIGHIGMSMTEQTAELDDVEITAISGTKLTSLLTRSGGSSTVTGLIPSIKFSGINLIELLKSRDLQLSSLVIAKPRLNFNRYKTHFEGSKHIDRLSLVKDFLKQFKGVRFENLIVQQGSISLDEVVDNHNLFELVGLDLELKQFDFSQSQGDLHLPSLVKSFEIALEDGQFNFWDLKHKLTTQDIVVSSDLKLAKAESLKLKPMSLEDSLADVFEVFVEQPRFYGLDVHELIMHNILIADTVEIGNVLAAIDMAGRTQKIMDVDEFVPYAEIEKIKLNNGSLALTAAGRNFTNLNSIEFDLYGFVLDSNRITQAFSVEDLEVKMGSSYFESLTGDILKSGNLDFSSFDSTIVFQGLEVELKNTHMDAPRLSVNSFDFEKLMNDTLSMGKVVLSNPVIQFENVSSENQFHPFSFNEIQGLISDSLASIDIAEIIIEQGKVTQGNTLGVDSIRLILSSFHMDTSSTWSNDNFFFSKSINLAAKNFYFTKEDSLTLGNFMWDMEKKILSLNDMNLVSPDGLSFDFPALELLGMQPLDLLVTNNLRFSRLSGTKAKLFLPLEGTENWNIREAFQSTVLNEIAYDSLSITNSKVTILKKDSSNNQKFEFDDFYLKTSSFSSLDSITELSPLIAKNIEWGFKNYKYSLPDSLNKVYVGEANFSTLKQKIELKNVEYFATVPKYDYGPKIGYQTDWKLLKVGNISLFGLNFFDAIYTGKFRAEKLRVDEFSGVFFRDKRIPFPKDQMRPMPQDALRMIPFYLNLDSAEIVDSKVTYQERLLTGLDEGYIDFFQINGLITNITNDGTKMCDQNQANVTVSGKIMGKGLIQANINLDLCSPTNEFDFEASLGEMQIAELNSILENTAFVHIKSGQVKRLELKASGNNDYAIGQMEFLYDKLHITTINKKNLKTKGMGKVISSFFANAFVVNRNNPNFLFARKGDIFFERNEQKVMFDYLAKSGLSGVVSSIGARSNRKEIKRIQNEGKKRKEEKPKKNAELETIITSALKEEEMESEAKHE